MRYSQLLVQAAELAKTEPERAEELLRKAESIALKAYPDDMILCARCWEDYFHNHDNSMRCMLEAECRSSNTSGFLAVAAAHLRHFIIQSWRNVVTIKHLRKQRIPKTISEYKISCPSLLRQRRKSKQKTHQKVDSA